MTHHADRIREMIAQAEHDLADIETQLGEGEIDAATAARLRRRYEQERTELLSQLESGDDAPVEPDGSVITPRRLAGAVILVIAAAGLTFGVVQATNDAEPAAEGVASQVLAGEDVNLDEISNEQMEEVVAANPDIAPMRLALADRYFQDGDFSNALTHYMYVLEDMGIQDPAALANVGWMTYLSGVPDVALSFVEQSLELQPDGGIAFWYLANIRYSGLGDAAGALAPLQSLLAYENLPEELRTEAEELLGVVEAAQ
jgi:tetratricopeptide (TPR) repeat protein